jgi:hypothetical protein
VRLDEYLQVREAFAREQALRLAAEAVRGELLQSVARIKLKWEAAERRADDHPNGSWGGLYAQRDAWRTFGLHWREQARWLRIALAAGPLLEWMHWRKPR